MIQHLRRGLFILLATFAVALGVLQLGGLGWAERLRLHEQDRQLARYKFFLSHKAPDRRPYRLPTTFQRYQRGVIEVMAIEVGLPCAATLGILAYTRRKRPKPSGPS